MKNGEEILKNCKKYFIETMSYSTDTAILLEDAVEAVDKALEEKESNILEETKENEEILDSEDFYDIMQAYRHSKMSKQHKVAEAFENVKKWIQENYKT